MSFEQEQIDGIDVVTLSGEIDQSLSHAMEEGFDTLCKEGTGLALVDMTDVTYISSFFLSLLLALSKENEKKGGRMIIVGIQPSVRGVIDVTGLGMLLDFADTREEALEELRAAGNA